MSIERVQARMSEIEAKRNRVMQKPALFAAMLEEKLGITQTATVLNNGLQSDSFVSSLAAQSADAQVTGGASRELIEQAQPYMDLIQNASAKYNIPVNLILGVIKSESDFNNNCVSYAGAKGLMQLMPENCIEDGVTDVFDPAQNIDAGTAEISRFISKYNGDLKLALAAYNTGPGNLSKRNVTSSMGAEYQTVPQIVREYVDRVLRYAGYGI